MTSESETAFIQSIASMMRSRDETQDENNADSENKELFVFLNSIVLQYLGILGLRKTCSTFLAECHDEGLFPSPSSLSSIDKFFSISDMNELRQKDVAQIMKCFDDENANALAEKWEYVAQVCQCQPDNQIELLKLNVQLRIYIYFTLPYLHNRSEDEKQMNIQRLIEEFKSKNHDDVNDAEVLSLYALPFVSNPKTHPVFSKFFTVKQPPSFLYHPEMKLQFYLQKSWIDSLRQSLQSFCTANCRKLPDPYEADLTKLYHLYHLTTNTMHDTNFGNLYIRHRTSTKLLKMSPSTEFQLQKYSGESPFKTFFDHILRLKEENEQLKQSDVSIKSTYMEKIQLCDALVTCLKELCKKDSSKQVPWNVLEKAYSQTTINDSAVSSATNICTSGKPSLCEFYSDFSETEKRGEFSQNEIPEGSSERQQSASIYYWNGKAIGSSSTRSRKESAFRIRSKPSMVSNANAKPSPDIKMTVTKDRGVGDCHMISSHPPPPPPPRFSNDANPRSLLQTNQILQRLVSESIHIDEAHKP